MAYLAQPDQQQTLEWIDGGLFTVLLDSKATEGQLTVGRFDIPKGEAPPFHLHTREDEVFLLKGEALVWVGDERHELSEGGAVYLPRNIPMATASPPTARTSSSSPLPRASRKCSGTQDATPALPAPTGSRSPRTGSQKPPPCAATSSSDHPADLHAHPTASHQPSRSIRPAHPNPEEPS
ncbi:cupin domain-containing protein [Streptomyces sp. NPDC051366]|uniref:cupin domain-containing protein n=1 Tax=Streptomyces sp. NPDC051366 TaxID=3365652 RepID=UPI0037A42EE9